MKIADCGLRIADLAGEPLSIRNPQSAIPLAWGTAQVLGFCLLTAAFAQVRIHVPGSPVPITLQTLAVLLAGFALPPARAALAMALYLLAGSVLVVAGWGGLSLFAATSVGQVWVTGGYLVGFLAAAPLVSLLCLGRRPSVSRLTAAGSAGTAVIFVLGTLWLYLVTPGGIGEAFAAGVVPFLPQAAVKLALAVAVVVSARRVAVGYQLSAVSRQPEKRSGD